jgi:hypothetical protein
MTEHHPEMPMPTHTADDAILLETRLERRDGATWITGLCSFCWERRAFRDAEVGTVARCKNDHAIHIVERQCVGACAPSEALEPRT